MTTGQPPTLVPPGQPVASRVCSVPLKWLQGWAGPVRRVRGSTLDSWHTLESEGNLCNLAHSPEPLSRNVPGGGDRPRHHSSFSAVESESPAGLAHTGRWVSRELLGRQLCGEARMCVSRCDPGAVDAGLCLEDLGRRPPTSKRWPFSFTALVPAEGDKRARLVSTSVPVSCPCRTVLQEDQSSCPAWPLSVRQVETLTPSKEKTSNSKRQIGFPVSPVFPAPDPKPRQLSSEGARQCPNAQCIGPSLTMTRLC